MSDAPKVVAFAGSLRQGSYNKKLLNIAVRGAQSEGAEVTVIDFNDYMLPLFNEDLEKARGLPDPGRRLKDIFLSYQGFLIATPEYNSSITPVLKNTLDWISRPAPGEPASIAFARKVAAIMSASPGGLGGQRSQMALRPILQDFRLLVLPDVIAVSQAHEAFTPSGDLKDEKLQSRARELGITVVRLINQMRREVS